MAAEPRPRPEWAEQTCAVCPAQLLGPGRFDVVDRPDRDRRYDPAVGYRIEAATGTPVCVHPYRVGLPPGRYASHSEPPPGADLPRPVPTAAALQLPDDVVDLEGWLIAMLRTATPDELASALRRAEALACRRFTPSVVVAALRRVVEHELAGR